MSLVEGDSTPVRRGVLAALLSAVVPGAGQWYTGRRRRALILASPLVALIVLAVILRTTTTNTDVLSALVQPRNLWALIVGNVVAVAWRLFAVADALRPFSSDIRRSKVVWIGVGALVAVVAAPHVIATAYGLRSIDVLENVFVADPPASGPGVTSPSVPVDSGETEDHDDGPLTIERETSDLVTVEYRAVGAIFRDGFGDPDAISIRRELRSGTPSAAPFVAFEDRLEEDRLTILLAGGDRGPGRDGLRTDTMIVATVDVQTGDAALFGLPRNYKRVPLAESIRHQFDELAIEQWEWEPDEDEDGFPDDWEDLDGDEIPDMPELHCHCFPEILNHLYGEAQGLGAFYPNSRDVGMDALADTIGQMIGLPIDYWMLVDMAGFVRLIDAMGGVDVWVTDGLHVGVSPSEEGLPTAIVNVEPGEAHLTGSEALAYVRWRRGSSDYVRMGRQRCLIRSVAAEADPVTLLRSFTSIADAIEDSVVTNIPLSFLPDLVDVVGRIDLDEVATLGLVPPRFSAERTPGRFPTPNVDRMRAAVSEVLEDGPSAVASPSGESECGI